MKTKKISHTNGNKEKTGVTKQFKTKTKQKTVLHNDEGIN